MSKLAHDSVCPSRALYPTVPLTTGSVRTVAHWRTRAGSLSRLPFLSGLAGHGPGVMLCALGVAARLCAQKAHSSIPLVSAFWAITRLTLRPTPKSQRLVDSAHPDATVTAPPNIQDRTMTG